MKRYTWKDGNLVSTEDLPNPYKPLDQRLKEIFNQQSQDTRTAFYANRAAIREALEDGNLVSAKNLINQVVVVDPALITVKAALIAEIEKELP